MPIGLSIQAQEIWNGMCMLFLQIQFEQIQNELNADILTICSINVIYTLRETCMIHLYPYSPSPVAKSAAGVYWKV